MTKFDTMYYIQKGFIPPEIKSTTKLANEVVQAFEYGPHAIKNAEKFRELQSEDMTLTDDQKRIRLAEYSKLITADAIGVMNKQLRRSADRVAYLTEKVESAYEAKDAATEIRLNGIADNLAKMERKERDSRIREAIQNNEDDILRAIVTRPQNSKVSTTFHYDEAKIAFEKSALGESDYTEFKDLREASAQLKFARDNLDDAMSNEFISGGDAQKANEAYEMLQRARAVGEVAEE